MLKRTLTSPIACLVLLFVLLLVSCGTPRATTSAPTARAALPQPVPVLIDLHTPDDLKARFNEDAGVPRIILLVSPT